MASQALIDTKSTKSSIAVNLYTYGDGSAAIRLGDGEHAPIAYLTPEKVRFIIDALESPDAATWVTFGEEILRRPWYHR